MSKSVICEAWSRRAGELLRGAFSDRFRIMTSATAIFQSMTSELEHHRRAIARGRITKDVPRRSIPLGYTQKARLVADGRTYLLKRTDEVAALRAERCALMANLFGIPTPPVVCVGIRGTCYAASPLLRGCAIVRPDTSLRAPRVVETLMATRLFNEYVWNLDCWVGNFLVPATTQCPEEVVNIDYDDSMMSRSPHWLACVLRDHFGLAAAEADCAWSHGLLDFDAPMRFDSERLDSHFTIYGQLWSQCSSDSTSHLPKGDLVEWVDGLDELSPSLLSAVWQPYVDVCWHQYRGFVPVQAAQAWLAPPDFVAAMHGRLRSVCGSFPSFIDEVDRRRRSGDLGVEGRGDGNYGRFESGGSI